MGNVVFKSISACNFGPFNETVEFNMQTEVPKNQLIENHTFIAGDNQRFNKIAYIFGANGAGKSNFGKIIIQIQKLIMLSPILLSSNVQLLEMKPFRDELSAPRNNFKFNQRSKDMPTSFEIQLMIDEVLYTYSFSLGADNSILAETLTKKKRRTEEILTRTTPKYDSIQLKSELKSFESNVSVVKENALCLSMAAFLNNELANVIVSAISRIQVVNMTAMNALSNLDEETFSNEKKEEYLKILSKADPTLKDIDVKFDEKKVEKHLFDNDDFENRGVIIRNIQVDVKSTHNIYNEGEVIGTSVLPFLQIESNGTIRLLNILPTIFETLQSGGILFVDEIENGLHPLITEVLVNLFYNPKTNPHNAQLICTTHSTQLIDSNVQKDEVWLIDKNQYGESRMKHISDILGLRSTDKIGNKMLKNAFGGMPDIL